MHDIILTNKMLSFKKKGSANPSDDRYLLLNFNVIQNLLNLFPAY